MSKGAVALNELLTYYETYLDPSVLHRRYFSFLEPSSHGLDEYYGGFFADEALGKVTIVPPSPEYPDEVLIFDNIFSMEVNKIERKALKEYRFYIALIDDDKERLVLRGQLLHQINDLKEEFKARSLYNVYQILIESLNRLEEKVSEYPVNIQDVIHKFGTTDRLEKIKWLAKTDTFFIIFGLLIDLGFIEVDDGRSKIKIGHLLNQYFDVRPIDKNTKHFKNSAFATNCLSKLGKLGFKPKEVTGHVGKEIEKLKNTITIIDKIKVVK